MDEVRVGHPTKAADDQYDSLDCLQDSKKASIKLAAEHWPVKPGGPGVLVVVDGVYATVVHDLSKPILLGIFRAVRARLVRELWNIRGPVPDVHLRRALGRRGPDHRGRSHGAGAAGRELVAQHGRRPRRA